MSKANRQPGRAPGRSLRGIEPLTYSMRMGRLGRLVTLTALAALRNSWSERWRRWRPKSFAEATADALRTNRPQRGQALAVRGVAAEAPAVPHPTVTHSHGGICGFNCVNHTGYRRSRCGVDVFSFYLQTCASLIHRLRRDAVPPKHHPCHPCARKKSCPGFSAGCVLSQPARIEAAAS